MTVDVHVGKHAYTISARSPNRRHHFEDLRIDGKIISE
jgi:hypothetical protein